MNPQTHTVFVSYSRLDSPLVSPITRLMRVVGAQAFQDIDSINPGQLWRQALITAIREASLVMVFWSRNAAASESVRAEWSIGLDERKIIVPVLLDSTPLDARLAEYQWLDLRTMSVVVSNLQADGKLPQEVLRNTLDAESVASAVKLLLNHIHAG